MKQKNCWEIMKCGREPNASNTKFGKCPAAQSSEFNGINNGELGGRFCWNLAGTFCKGEISGAVAKKIQNCFECPFLQMVRDEEGEKFILNQNDAKTKQA